jgi:hypothetical protein
VGNACTRIEKFGHACLYEVMVRDVVGKWDHNIKMDIKEI